MRTSKLTNVQPRKPRRPAQSKERGPSDQSPAHGLPVSPCDDLQARIAKRAYEIHAEQGHRYGYALADWLEAEREILTAERHP